MSTKLTQIQESENHIKLEPTNAILQALEVQVANLCHEVDLMRTLINTISMDRSGTLRTQAKLEAIRAIIGM